MTCNGSTLFIYAETLREAREFASLNGLRGRGADIRSEWRFASSSDAMRGYKSICLVTTRSETEMMFAPSKNKRFLAIQFIAGATQNGCIEYGEIPQDIMDEIIRSRSSVG